MDNQASGGMAPLLFIPDSGMREGPERSGQAGGKASQRGRVVAQLVGVVIVRYAFLQ